MIKHIFLSATLAFAAQACTDDQQEAEEVVQMDEEGQENDQGNFVPPEPDMAEDASFPTDESTALQPEAVNSEVNEATNQLSEGEGEGEQGLSADDSSTQHVMCFVLRIRTGPGLDHGTAGYLLFNAEVHPLSEQDGWVKIAENKWVSKAFLKNGVSPKPTMPGWAH